MPLRPARLRTLLAAGFFLALLLPPAPARAAGADRPIALELLLAVDVSTSVDRREYELQMTGLALAFLEPSLIAAIAAQGADGIVVALAQWSDRKSQAIAVDWTQIRDAADAIAFSQRLQATPRAYRGGDTALRAAIDFSAGQFAGNGWAGARRVIDLSGDGGGLPHPTYKPDQARDRALALGITINGLAILDLEPWLDRFFRAHVIGGPGAFVLAAQGYDDFARAILTKLIREIGDPVIAAAPAR